MRTKRLFVDAASVYAKSLRPCRALNSVAHKILPNRSFIRVDLGVFLPPFRCGRLQLPIRGTKAVWTSIWLRGNPATDAVASSRKGRGITSRVGGYLNGVYRSGGWECGCASDPSDC
ncbi:MAG: hypothetical protein ACPGKG_09020 [Paracoccaceae bacterium]